MDDTNTPPPLRTVRGDTPEAEGIMQLVNVWRQTFAMFEVEAGRGSADTIDPNALSYAMTAAAIMAGTYFGNSIVAGLATDQDKLRAKDMFARNFRTGIDIGKRQGFRVAADMPVGGSA